VARVRAARPQLVLGPSQRRAIDEAVAMLRSTP
jgi:hypothetical protein